MKRWRFVVLIHTLVLAALVIPSSARAVETHELSFKGHIVRASFSAPDQENQCLVNNVNVQAAEGTFDDESGAPAFFGKVFVSVFQINTCPPRPGVVLSVAGIVPFDDQAFEADNQLNTASLNTTVDICDDKGERCLNVSINLKWWGIGDSTRRQSQSRTTTPTCRTQSHIDDLTRSAFVSGHISSNIFRLDLAVDGSGHLALARNWRIVARGEDCDSGNEGGGRGFPI